MDSLNDGIEAHGWYDGRLKTYVIKVSTVKALIGIPGYKVE